MRESLRSLQNRYTEGDRTPLENLVRAFRGIQRLPPTDPNSFHVIAGYHGQPFRESAKFEHEANGDYWGGYCNHNNILFPTWHRAYLLRLENALRSIAGCAEVTLPFWDECFDRDADVQLPEILTSPTFPLDGDDNNPLYSYKFAYAVSDDAARDNLRWDKPAGYDTVRYPLSGLVGTPLDREATFLHNSAYTDPKTSASYLNSNIKAWLNGAPDITPDDPKNPTRTPAPSETTSVVDRYQKCLRAPSYTVFSNKLSADAYTKEQHLNTPQGYTSLESPHNSIHLAVGGFYQRASYNANHILGANGDMGENETAAFDPIFFLHHAFVDYTFWMWQKLRGKTAAGSLDLDTFANRHPPFPGTFSTGLPGQQVFTELTLSSPLAPFVKADGTAYVSLDVVDIVNQLGYDYGPGSLDQSLLMGSPEPATAFKISHDINREQIAGSFVIRTYAYPKNREDLKVEIGREAILSRWSVARCANCQGKTEASSIVPIYPALIKALDKNGDGSNIEYHAELTTRSGKPLFEGVGSAEVGRKIRVPVEDL
jgi:tyrosinase